MIYSFTFIMFVIILLLLYYTVFRNRQWVLLLIGSCLFYLANDYKYFAYMVFVTWITFAGAKRIEQYAAEQREQIRLHKGEWSLEEKKAYKASQQKKKRLVSVLIALVCFGVLMLFKCTKFIPGGSLILPLGISFYTFQSIGYLVDVYRGNCEAERSFWRYALFVTYFPAIIEGPIHRFSNLSVQFYRKHTCSFENIKSGVWLFLWGLFKKLVIADRLVIFVNQVFDQTILPSGSVCVMAVFLFNIQLYADFSGGIDMVRGVSQMFDITMAENFKRPFFSQSIGEYWHRWHISLGDWIRDYVFYPLAISRTNAQLSKKLPVKSTHLKRTIPAGIISVITFLLIGLWHDISPAYVAYGLWHGMLMACSEIFAPAVEKVNSMIGISGDRFSVRLARRIRTWLLVSVGETFTIAGSFGAAIAVFRNIFTRFRWYDAFVQSTKWGLDGKDFVVIILAVLFWLCISMQQEKGVRIREHLARQPEVVQSLVTAGCVILIAVFGVYGLGYDAANFIYGGF